MMALKPGDLPGPPGQIELFRRFALGNFRNLLIEVARDPAMLVWLDGRQNVRNRPQENFAREIMELFTWESATTRNRMAPPRECSLAGTCAMPRLEAMPIPARITSSSSTRASTTPRQDLYLPDLRRRQPHDPARSAADGMQDGIDFITALAQHPQTARRLARKLWNFFVSELEAPDPAFVESVASEYCASGTEMKPVVRHPPV